MAGISGRTLRVGGISLIVGPVQFVIVTTAEAFLLVANGYSYSFLSNTISNLGDPSLYPFPYYWMLNGSAIVLGALVLLGVPALWSTRPRSYFGLVGTILVALVGVGAIGVGVFNEHLNYPVHISVAALAFIGGGLALLVIGIGAFLDSRWKEWAVPSIVGAGVTTVGLVLFTSETTWLLGHGGWERVIVVAPIIWIVLVGVKVLRSPSPSEDASNPPPPTDT